MKRLTDRTAYGLAYVKSETGVEGIGAATTQRRLPELISRLAAYEDTGLEPEEVAVLVKENVRFRDTLERTERERDAAIADIYNMGGCPNCKYNSGRNRHTGLPICVKNMGFPDGKCFDWRGLEAALAEKGAENA